MLPILLALAAASSWGFSAVLVRRGLRELPTTVGTLLSLTSGLVVTGVLTVVLQWDTLTSVSWGAVALFGLIGVLNFPIGRFCNYMAIGRLGVGRSTPLLASSPLVAVLIAVVVTGESLTAKTAVAMVLILSGILMTVTAPR